MGQELDAVAAAADHMGDESMVGEVGATVVAVVPSLLRLTMEFPNSGLSIF